MSVEFVISPENIAQFTYGQTNRRIWASLRNSQSLPTLQWQFGYDPLFLPEVDNSGKLVTSKKKIANVQRVSLKIYLDNAQAKTLAYAAVATAFPAQASSIVPANVAAIGLTNLTLSVTDLNLITGASLSSPALSFAVPTSNFMITIDTPDDNTANAVVDLLQQGTRVDYTMSIAAKTVQVNSVNVTYSNLKSSQLYVKLNGLGTTTTYVHRDDMRNLMEGIYAQLSIQGTLEEPDRFDQALFEKILASLTTEVNTEAAAFTAQQWQATYNGDDLKPDVITHDLEQMFDYDGGTNQWKYNIAFDASGKADFIKVMSAEARVKGSYSSDELHQFLKQHQIESDVTGTQIRAKSIDLQQVNLNDFNAAGQFTSVMAYVSTLRDPIQGNIDIASLLANREAELDLPSRVAEIERKACPIGKLSSYAGTNMPDGWMLCDGRPLKSTDYNALFIAIGTDWGAGVDQSGAKVGDFNLPDGRGRFLRGVDGGAGRDPDASTRTHSNTGGLTGDQVGSIQSYATARPTGPSPFVARGADGGVHQHLEQFSQNPGPDRGVAGVAGNGINDAGAGKIYTVNDGSHQHSVDSGGDQETRPANMNIHWMIRAF